MSTDTHRTFSESKPQMATPNVPPGPKGSQPSKNQVEKINPNQPSRAMGDDDYMDYIKHLSKVRDENIVQREEVQDEDVNSEDHDANAPAAVDQKALEQLAADQLVEYFYDDPEISCDIDLGWLKFARVFSDQYWSPLFGSTKQEFFDLVGTTFRYHKRHAEVAEYWDDSD